MQTVMQQMLLAALHTLKSDFKWAQGLLSTFSLQIDPIIDHAVQKPKH